MITIEKKIKEKFGIIQNQILKEEFWKGPC